ncbi:formylmethanofuran dehydrogenase subunit E [Desulfofundulus australicus DSM 11792]|uniref:Formylmethanofuran dehydrogenase subunit E n=1 Tax=Desulfofundulus australicus DSM 11792 TaxID=1121425 RepID=A0A1M5A8K6_9FIRM|nr:FmdE family protein [Desulfofundulus australicus]SHF26514.1 formylmethanofuran dehydrogenase subunit E [Desulfofundulus australicus DSM 11792]
MTDWEKVVSFHGHSCCLLAIGYRATKVALEKLNAHLPGYNLVTVVENRTCAADAVQVVSGCTFGKRNFIYKDNGKYVFTFACMGERQALRVSLRAGVLSKEGDDFVALMEKVANGVATEGEREEFYRRQEPLMKYILEGPVEEIFEMQVVNLEKSLPELCLQMITCSRCGEEMMKDHAFFQNGRPVCKDCLV